MLVDLATDELSLITEILDQAYADMREEIHKTEDYDYKRRLKERERRLRDLIHKISGTMPGPDAIQQAGGNEEAPSTAGVVFGTVVVPPPTWSETTEKPRQRRVSSPEERPHRPERSPGR